MKQAYSQLFHRSHTGNTPASKGDLPLRTGSPVRPRRAGTQRGATLVEVLIAIALSGILLPIFAEAALVSQAVRPTAAVRLQAQSLLREGMEAVRVAREAGWTSVATNGTYHPIISGTSWSLSGGSETIGNLTRSIIISSVQRDGSGALVASGGTVDPSTKKAVVTITWTQPTSGVLSDETYLSRWQNNTSWIQTTQTDFNAGTLNNTVVTNTAGGEVQLNGGGSGVSWANPTQAGVFNVSGNTDASGVYVDSATNRAYVITGSILNIINVTNPAATTLLGSINTSNQLNGVYVVGNFAYLASANNTGELTIINVSNPAAPTLAKAFDLGDAADATSIFVSGSFAYVGKILSTTGGINEFYIINITNPAAPSLTGSLNLTGTVNGVYVSGTLAYLATDISNAELTVVNIANPATPTIDGTFDAPGTVGANAVFRGPVYLYLGETVNGSGPEFYILNVSNLASITTVGTFEDNATIKGINIVGSEAFIADSTRFAVLDLTTPATPVLEGQSGQPSLNGLMMVNNLAYLASTGNNSELTILQPTATTGGGGASGTYESATLDAGAAVGFNAFSFTTLQPTGTTVTLQIAANNDNATWNYVGPDGTALTVYTAPGPIPLNLANFRYFRFKVSMSTPSKNTLPVLFDATVNYSP